MSKFQLVRKLLLLNLNTSGCMLSALLFTRLTHYCNPKSEFNLIMKYAEDMISSNDDASDREEVERLVSWDHNNTTTLSFKVDKTKEAHQPSLLIQ